MATRFLYIDDEPQKAQGIIKPIEDGSLSFEVQKPRTWNEQKAFLIDSKELDKYDGLLLDLKLEFSNGDNNDVKFGGADLAQTIRSAVKAGDVKDLPIFLCSTDENLMKFFDRTSIDLFDKHYSKNKNLALPISKAELISFSEAYQAARESLSLEHLLKKSSTENDGLISVSGATIDFKTPHEFIYLINRYLIQEPGLLIDEHLFSIRLGVDIVQSPEWSKLKTEILKPFQYIGVLGYCYERWWQADVLKWWKETFGKSLIVMTAQEKVKLLNEKYKFDITPLQLPENHRFDTFWYKCRLSNTHLDPSDALRTIEMPRYDWQEPKYISLSYIKSDERDKEAIISLLGANELRMFENL